MEGRVDKDGDAQGKGDRPNEKSFGLAIRSHA